MVGKVIIICMGILKVLILMKKVCFCCCVCGGVCVVVDVLGVGECDVCLMTCCFDVVAFGFLS